jgi:hypothetical protein
MVNVHLNKTDRPKPGSRNTKSAGSSRYRRGEKFIADAFEVTDEHILAEQTEFVGAFFSPSLFGGVNIVAHGLDFFSPGPPFQGNVPEAACAVIEMAGDIFQYRIAGGIGQHPSEFYIDLHQLPLVSPIAKEEALCA